MYQNKLHEFSFTQLVAMFFGHIKKRIVKWLEIKGMEIPLTTNCVISCPGWFTDGQRRAIIDAAKIANLNCIRVMNDLTAVALYYLRFTPNLPSIGANENVKPRIVCFVDIGHSCTQVSIVEIAKKYMCVRGAAYDHNLGGRDFDSVLTEKYLTKFDLDSNAELKHRLTLACENIKKV